MSTFNRGNTRAAKLTPQQVLEIREKSLQGYTQARLSREYLIGTNQVGKIIRGEAWQTVAMPLTETDHEGIIRRLAELQARINAEAEKTPAGMAVRADQELDKLAAKAADYGAKHIEVVQKPEPVIDDATRRYMEMVAKTQGENT